MHDFESQIFADKDKGNWDCLLYSKADNRGEAVHGTHFEFRVRKQICK